MPRSCTELGVCQAHARGVPACHDCPNRRAPSAPPPLARQQPAKPFPWPFAPGVVDGPYLRRGSARAAWLWLTGPAP